MLKSLKRKPEYFPAGALSYEERNDILNVAYEKIEKTATILDIGPGLRPVNLFTPETHIMIEGFKPYIDKLQKKFAGYPGAVFINALAEEALPLFPDRSVDSIFLLDVLEHMKRDVGLKVLKHCNRIARKQVIINTPLGYVEQHYEEGETDGWGFSYNKLQNHQSGWTEADFQDGWDLTICKEFGTHQQNGESYGLIFAIKNIEEKNQDISKKILVVSGKVNPSNDKEWKFMNEFLKNIPSASLTALTLEKHSPYAAYHLIEDIVSHAENRLPIHYQISKALENGDSKLLRQEIMQAFYKNNADLIIFTDETPQIFENIKKICADSNIPAICLSIAGETPFENSNILRTVKKSENASKDIRNALHDLLQ